MDSLGFTWVTRIQRVKNKARTPLDVRKDLSRRGLSIAAASRQLQVPEQTVRDLLSGKAKGHRGIAHKAAVLLGLKVGVIDPRATASAARTGKARAA